MPFASKEFCQKEIAKINKEEVENLEIKIEFFFQHECSGRAMLAHEIMDKE